MSKLCLAFTALETVDKIGNRNNIERAITALRNSMINGQSFTSGLPFSEARQELIGQIV